MTDAGPAYCAYVKNLKDGKKMVVQLSDVWEISEVKKSLWKREKISTGSISKEKCKSQDVLFGIIEGEYMIKHFIIDYAESQEKLLESVKASRPRDPKRLSVSDAAVPLVYFTNYEERVENTVEKAKMSKSKRLHPNEKDDILDRFRKKKKHNDEHELKGLKVVDSHEILSSVDKLSVSQTSPSTSSHTEKSYSRNEELSVEVIAVPSTSKGASVEIQLAEMRAVNEKLKTKIKSLCDQRDQALSEAMALRLHVDQLQSELSAAKKALQDVAPKTLLEEIAATVKKIPTTMQSSTGDSCKVRSLIYACKLEEEYKEFVVPPGMTYVGQGQTVSHKDILEIEDDYDSFNLRGEHVFNLICKDGIQNYSLAGHKNCKKPTKVIPEHVQKATKRILKAMEWPPSIKVDSAAMKKFFHKQPGDARRRGTSKKKPEENTKPQNSQSESRQDNEGGEASQAKSVGNVEQEVHNVSFDDEKADVAEERNTTPEQHVQLSAADLEMYLSRSSPDRQNDDS